MMSEKSPDKDSDAWIPNIVLGEDYDLRFRDAPIHYDVLTNLATFFGRDMPVHRHAQYLQIHYIDSGRIRFHIDDKVFDNTGPCCYLTPPSVPHSFRLDDEARGHVFTIHESLIWRLQRDGKFQVLEPQLQEGFCLQKALVESSHPGQWARLEATMSQIGDEWQTDLPGKMLALESLIALLIVQVSRLSEERAESADVNNDDLRLFRRYSTLIEAHYREHRTLPEYTAELGVSESRLGSVCQRIASKSPKRLIHDRLLQEAKRLLLFTGRSFSDICYDLGFSDPAYFARFFKRHTSMTAQQFRQQHNNAGKATNQAK